MGFLRDHKCWPFQRGIIKLPLGLHRKTNLLSCFLDHQGQPIPLGGAVQLLPRNGDERHPARGFLNRTSENLTEPIMRPQSESVSVQDDDEAIPDQNPKRKLLAVVAEMAEVSSASVYARTREETRANRCPGEP